MRICLLTLAWVLWAPLAQGGEGQSPAVASEAASMEAGPWWRQLKDPALQNILDQAFRANPDLEAVRALKKQAVGRTFQQASGSLPNISASYGSSWAPTDTLGFGFGLGDIPGSGEQSEVYASGQASVNLNWNVDVFGQNISMIRASQRDAQAIGSDVYGQQTRLALLVVGTYLDAVTAKIRLGRLETQLKTQEDLLEALTLRYAGSEVGALDVLQQRQAVANQRVQIPNARLAYQSMVQQLAVLMGKVPSKPVAVAEELPTLPVVPSEVDVALLVADRPELSAARRRLQAAKNRHWSAWAGALPQFGVTGQIGEQFFDAGERSTTQFWNVGGTVTLPIFSGGRTYGGIRQARAVVMESEARYRSAELSALQRAEGARVRDREQGSLVDALESQREAADQAWELARERVLNGLTPYLNAQTTLSRKQQAELALLQGQRDALAARIEWMDSIGGARIGAPANEGKK